MKWCMTGQTGDCNISNAITVMGENAPPSSQTDHAPMFLPIIDGPFISHQTNTFPHEQFTVAHYIIHCKVLWIWLLVM